MNMDWIKELFMGLRWWDVVGVLGACVSLYAVVFLIIALGG
jgi:hypothetical protein